MKTTMDKAGRIVVPKSLRDQIGLVPGEVEVVAESGGLRIDVVFDSRLEYEPDGAPLLPAGGITMTPDELREFRLVDQR